MLSLADVHISYGPVAAVRGCSIAVEQGEYVALVGPNGAGKSTLLKTVAGLLTPRAGVIRWEEEMISATPPQRPASTRSTPRSSRSPRSGSGTSRPTRRCSASSCRWRR